MNEFTPVYNVKAETKFHFKKEILALNKAESELNKDIWFQNYTVNGALLKKHKKADMLFNDKKWAQQECLIVGAGPSLDLDIEHIKKYRKKRKHHLRRFGFKPSYTQWDKAQSRFHEK